MELNIPENELAKALVGGRAGSEVTVRWGDLDALNHVNNTLYFRYLEEARIKRLRDADIAVAGTNRRIVVARCACDFLRPIGWPATIYVDMVIVRVGRSSLEYEAELHVVGDTSGPSAKAQVIIVGTDAQTGRSAPWTESELQALAQVFVSPGA